MATALRAQQGQRGADDREWAEKIDVEDMLHRRGVGTLDRAEQTITRIVDDDVEPTVQRLRFADHVARAVKVAYIEREHIEPFGGKPFGRFAVAGRADDMIATCKRGLGESEAESPRNACDEPVSVCHDGLLLSPAVRRCVGASS
jgi:hypothetical protein